MDDGEGNDKATEGGQRLCFHRFMRLSVSFFVCEQGISKSYGWIQKKLGRHVGCLTMTK